MARQVSEVTILDIVNAGNEIERSDEGIEYYKRCFLMKRKCYTNIYNKMKRYIEDRHEGQRNFIVYGNEGIGKTRFCLYLCREFLSKSNYQVIFRLNRTICYYKNVEDKIYSENNKNLPERKINNSNQRSIIICDNISISEDEYSEDDVVILVSSMQLENYKVMRSKRAPIQFCLLPFNDQEIKFYAKRTNSISLQTVYKEKYGGIPGLFKTNLKNIIERSVNVNVYSGIPAKYNEFVYIYDVDNEFEIPHKLKYISKYTEEIALKKVIIDKNNYSVYLALLAEKIEGDNERIGGEGGWYYEHLILYYIKSKYENTVNNKLELDKLNEKDLPLLINCSFQSNFECVDGIEINEKCINGIQVTVSENHSIKESVAILFNVIFQETYENRKKSILKMLENKEDVNKLAEILYYLGYTPSSSIDKALNDNKNEVNNYIEKESELRFGFKLPILFELVTIPDKNIDNGIKSIIKKITMENMNKIFDEEELKIVIDGIGFVDDDLKIIYHDYSEKELEELKKNNAKWKEYQTRKNKKPFENYKNDIFIGIIKEKVRKLILDAKDYAYDYSIQNEIDEDKTKAKSKNRVDIMKKNKDKIIKEIDEDIKKIKDVIMKERADEEIAELKKSFDEKYLHKYFNPRFVITMISHKYDVTMDIEESFDFSKYTDILEPKMSKYIKHIYPSFDSFKESDKKRIMTNRFKRVEKANEIISYIELDRKIINDPEINLDNLYYRDDNKKDILFKDDDLRMTQSLISTLESNQRMKRFLDSNFIYLNPSNMLCSSYKEGLDKLDMILSNYISPTTFKTPDGQKRNYCNCIPSYPTVKPSTSVLIELVKEERKEKVNVTSRDELDPISFTYDYFYSLLLKAKGKGNENEVYKITEILTCPYCHKNTEILRECEYLIEFDSEKTFFCNTCKKNVKCQPILRWNIQKPKTELKFIKGGIDIYYNNVKQKRYEFGDLASATTEIETEEDNSLPPADNFAIKIKNERIDSEHTKKVIKLVENAASEPPLPSPLPSNRDSFDYLKRIFHENKQTPEFICNETLIKIDGTLKIFQYPMHKILVRDYYSLIWKRIEYNIIYNCFSKDYGDENIANEVKIKLLKYINVNVDLSKLNEIVENEKERLKKLIKYETDEDMIKSYYLLRGQPGCGKSTFLVYFILKFIQLKEKIGINLGLTYYKSSKKEDGSLNGCICCNLIGNYLKEGGTNQDIIICDSYDICKEEYTNSNIIVNVSSPDNKNYSNIIDFTRNKVYFYLDICNKKEIKIWKENCLPEDLGNAIDNDLISLYNRVPRHLYFAAIYKTYYKDRNYWDEIYRNCIRTTVNNFSYFGFIKKYLYPCERGKESNLEEDNKLIVDRLDSDLSHYIVKYKVLDYDSIDKFQLEFISKEVFKYVYFCTTHRCNEYQYENMKDFFFNTIKCDKNHPLYKLLFNELVWYSLMYNAEWKNRVIKFDDNQMNIFNENFKNTTTSMGCGDGYYIGQIKIEDYICFVINNVVVFPLYDENINIDVNNYKMKFKKYGKAIQCGVYSKIFKIEDIIKLKSDELSYRFYI